MSVCRTGTGTERRRQGKGQSVTWLQTGRQTDDHGPTDMNSCPTAAHPLEGKQEGGGTAV